MDGRRKHAGEPVARPPKAARTPQTQETPDDPHPPSRHRRPLLRGGAALGALLCAGARGLFPRRRRRRRARRPGRTGVADHRTHRVGGDRHGPTGRRLGADLGDRRGGGGENAVGCDPSTTIARGNGAAVTGTVGVSPGQTLEVAVGGPGQTDRCAGATSSAGGWGRPDGFSPGAAGRSGYPSRELPSGGGGGATVVTSADGVYLVSAGAGGDGGQFGGGGGGGGGADSFDDDGGVTGVTTSTASGAGTGSVVLTWPP